MEGMILSHVDDFILAGMDNFIEKITEEVKKKLNISKLENDEFRFTGIDVLKEEDRIVKSIEDYAQSMEKLEIRK